MAVELRGPTSFNPASALGLLRSGSEQLSKAAQNYSERIRNKEKNKAISELLLAKPKYNDTEEGLAGYGRDITSALLRAPGVSPAEALGLSTTLTQPYYNKLDRDIKRTTQDETARHNAASEAVSALKGYGSFTDDYGNAYVLDKSTGEFKPVSTGGGSSGSMYNPKFTKIETKMFTDENGNDHPVQIITDTRTGGTTIRSIGTTPAPQGGSVQKSGSTIPIITTDDNGNIVKRGGSAEAAPAISYGKESAATAKERTDLSNMTDAFNAVKENYRPEFVGPYDARVEGAKSNMGFGNEQFNAMEGAMEQLKMKLRHSMFGSALTANEIKAWEKAIPPITASETEFVPKWNQFVDQTVEQYNTLINDKMKSGKAEGAKALIDEMMYIADSKLPMPGSKEETPVADPSLFSAGGRTALAEGFDRSPVETITGVLESSTIADARDMNKGKALLGDTDTEAFNAGKNLGETVQMLIPEAEPKGFRREFKIAMKHKEIADKYGKAVADRAVDEAFGSLYPPKKKKEYEAIVSGARKSRLFNNKSDSIIGKAVDAVYDAVAGTGDLLKRNVLADKKLVEEEIARQALKIIEANPDLAAKLAAGEEKAATKATKEAAIEAAREIAKLAAKAAQRNARIVRGALVMGAQKPINDSVRELLSSDRNNSRPIDKLMR